jgi:hypothetical protein
MGIVPPPNPQPLPNHVYWHDAVDWYPNENWDKKLIGRKRKFPASPAPFKGKDPFCTYDYFSFDKPQ